MSDRTISYEAWRITYQDSEQAARALWGELAAAKSQLQRTVDEYKRVLERAEKAEAAASEAWNECETARSQRDDAKRERDDARSALRDAMSYICKDSLKEWTIWRKAAGLEKT